MTVNAVRGPWPPLVMFSSQVSCHKCGAKGPSKAWMSKIMRGQGDGTGPAGILPMRPSGYKRPGWMDGLVNLMNAQLEFWLRELQLCEECWCPVQNGKLMQIISKWDNARGMVGREINAPEEAY